MSLFHAMVHPHTAPTKQAGLQFGLRSNTWEVTGSIIMNKWQWPIMNGCKCKSQFLAPWNLQLMPEDGKHTPLCSGDEEKSRSTERTTYNEIFSGRQPEKNFVEFCCCESFKTDLQFEL